MFAGESPEPPRFEDLDLELPSAAVSIVAVSGNAHGEGAKTWIPLRDIASWTLRTAEVVELWNCYFLGHFMKTFTKQTLVTKSYHIIYSYH